VDELTLQGSDVCLPELSLFVWAFVEANHGKMILEHLGHSSIGFCFLEIKIRSLQKKG